MTDEHSPELERRLRGHLSRRAGEAEPTSDFESVTRRAAGVDARQRRLLVVALVVVLLLGPVIGFVVGRGVADDDEVTAAGDEVGSADEAEAPGDPDPPPEQPADVAAAESGRSLTGPGIAYDEDGGIVPAELVTLRSTNAVDIRVFRSTYGEVYALDIAPPWAPGWTPTGVCAPTASLQAGLSTELAVGNAWHELWPEVPATSLNAGAFGVEFGDPHWWVAVQAGPRVAAVRVLFSSGAVDEMAVVDGVAVLAGPAEEGVDDPWLAQGLVATLDANGQVLEEIPLGEQLYENAYTVYDDPDYEARCVPPPPPPPELPPAGEQPADVAAASAAVTEALEVVLDGSRSDAEREPYLDDPSDAVAAARNQAVESFGDIIASARAEVREMVFTAPDVAVVRYDITVEGFTNFTNQFGEARLIDGSWKITTPTVCAALGLAGAGCEGVEPYPQPDPYAVYDEAFAEAEVSESLPSPVPAPGG